MSDDLGIREHINAQKYNDTKAIDVLGLMGAMLNKLKASDLNFKKIEAELSKDELETLAKANDVLLKFFVPDEEVEK